MITTKKRLLIVVSTIGIVATGLLLVFIVITSQNANTGQNILSIHLPLGISYPAGTKSNLIERDIYVLCNNPETKFADWVAYRLDIDTISGDSSSLHRNWKADPDLRPDETLEPRDFYGAYKSFKFDRGHQAPLASFKGTDSWEKTNYLSNITPQKASLNRGIWKYIENTIRDLTYEFEVLYVITGTLYEEDMPSLPNADKLHQIPSGYWKIVYFIDEEKTSSSLKICSFIFNQDTSGDVEIIEHLVSVDEIEERTGYDFFIELPEKIETRIEEEIDVKLVETWFRD